MMSEKSAILLADISKTANQWLLGSALPIWFENGVDWNYGGFYEYLSKDDLTCAAEFKRLRVVARQIYVFSVGMKLGENYCRQAVTHGVEFLLHKSKIRSGGFASRSTICGDIVEEPLDLYDHSFCLFALAHAYKVLGDESLKYEAITLLVFILEHFKHKREGFVDNFPASHGRRQNPHMHLLEALLEWRLISDQTIFKEITDEIVTLFFKKFYFPQSGVLLEYFDDDLKPELGCRGEITEPGHHFEWLWLLNRYSALSDAHLADYSNLYFFASEHGVSNTNGLLFGEVLINGSVTGPYVRLWPHTEWLKAELVSQNDIGYISRVTRAWDSIFRFLDCPQMGLWHERFDHSSKTFVEEPSPASSFYHIALAIDTLNDLASNISTKHE